MGAAQISLRSLIEKWFAPSATSRVRLTRYVRAHPMRSRCVRVEALRSQDPVAIYFFQHGDGTWRLFPPEFGRTSTCIGYEVAG
jgi:hypothetical protein